MKPLKQFSTVILLLTILIIIISPGATYAQANTLSSGDYAGRFHYTVHWIMVDNQSSGDVTSHLEYIGNIDIEGTLIFSVDMKGMIKSGAEFHPGYISTYEIHTFRLTPAKCDILSYLSGETTASIKQDTSAAQSASAPLLKGIINMAAISPVYFRTSGTSDDCPYVPSQPLLTKWTNDHISTLNNLKTMDFLVVRSTDHSISGSISIPGVAQSMPSPGGMIVHKEDGYFLVNKIDLLTPLEDDSLAPLGEWRQK